MAVTQGSVVVRARLVQAMSLATAAAKVAKLRARQRLGVENEACEKPNPPSPHLISSQWQPKGLFPLIFAIIANLWLACITRKSNFQYLII